MGKCLTWWQKDFEIGAYDFPDRKKPTLCIKQSNVLEEYGYFKSPELADMFMKKLGEILGAEEDG